MVAIPATGQLQSGLGGPAGYGETTVARNDDGFQSIDISSVFPNGLTFFGQTYHSLYVNTNGSLSFGSGVSTYTPTSINAGSTPMIAAFWADVDTRTPAATGTDSAPIYVDLDTVNHVFTATWAGVNYYSEHGDKKDYFQIQLYDLGHGNFDIVFRYQNIQWTTGDASGGSGGLGGQIAHAGYTAGDGAHFSELPASGTSAMLNLPATAGNTGVNGFWEFQIQSGLAAAGFDTSIYPTDDRMAWIKQNTNFQWVAYYLAPTDSGNRTNTSWMGHRAALEAQGWNIAPTYFGEQDPNAGHSHDVSGPNGLFDGQDAVKLLKGQGFATGTVCYLDIESTNGQPLAQATQDYIKDWALEVSAAGYVPGVYCVHNQTDTISALIPAAFWVVSDTSASPPPPTQASPGNVTNFATDDPSASSYADAVAWQYNLTPTHGYNLSIPATGSQAATTITIDLDTARLPAVIHGNDGQDLLTGTNGDDLIFGLSGNDTINGLAGNDKIDGGAGLDTVNFAGARASYTITAMGSGVFKVAGPTGTDLLSNVEKLVFTDTTVTEAHPKSDYNGDFLSDILWHRDDGVTSIWDAGQMNLAHVLSTIPTEWKIVGTGDFDGNASADILWQRNDGTFSIWDDGNIQTAHVIANAGAVASTSHVAGTGDFDGNGQSDILWKDDNGQVFIWDNGQSSGSHVVSNAGFLDNTWHIVSTGDFDGNGKSDILWHNDNGAYTIWDNGQLSGAHTIAAPGFLTNAWQVAGTGDFDGNGKTDILWQRSDGVVSIWDNGQASGAHVIANAGFLDSSWHIAGVGDYDGNGKSDILWHNDNGTYSIWDNGQSSTAHVIASAGEISSNWHVV